MFAKFLMVMIVTTILFASQDTVTKHLGRASRFFSLLVCATLRFSCLLYGSPLASAP